MRCSGGGRETATTLMKAAAVCGGVQGDLAGWLAGFSPARSNACQLAQFVAPPPPPPGDLVTR